MQLLVIQTCELLNMVLHFYLYQGEYRGNLVSTGCAFAFRSWVESKVDTIGIASLVVIIPQVSLHSLLYYITRLMVYGWGHVMALQPHWQCPSFMPFFYYQRFGSNLFNVQVVTTCFIRCILSCKPS